MSRSLGKLGIEKLPEFDNHKLVNFIYDEPTGLKGFIAIHRGNPDHPAFGATRLWRYKSDLEALRDALRLSKTMSYKAALAGLPYGGGKGVLLETSMKPHQRRAALKVYAERVNCLAGHFITGADVGISREDVRVMRRKSPYIVGLKSDPAKLTALGVFYSIEVCLKEIFGNTRIKEHSFAIQGLGKVGTGLLEMLYTKGGRILAADIDRDRVRAAQKTFPEIEVVKPAEIHQQPVDIFSPCALSGVINRKNIPELGCQAIVGAANNQLEDERAGELLYQRGVLYAPDYVVNAGGLISVVDEFENRRLNRRRIEKRIAQIKESLRKILGKSKRQKRAPNLIADEMSERILHKID